MRLGVLDIGSNTVHLLLLDAHPGGRPTAYADHKKPLSLIQHLDEDGKIRETGVQELISFIKEAVAFAHHNGAEDMISFTTSAIRESANGAEVLERITAETGIYLSELTGDEEAAMTYFAVRRWHGWHVEHLLNFDIGGGSFEISFGQDELPTKAISVPLGATRLTREFVDGDPPTRGAVRAMKRHIDEVLAEHVREFPEMPDNLVVTGTSKTFRSLARITGAAPSSDGPFISRTLRRSQLKHINGLMGEMTAQQRLQLPGVSDVRAHQVFAGGLVAHAAMKAFGVKKLTICPWALREGLLLGRLDALLIDGVVNREAHHPWISGVDLGTSRPAPGLSVGVEGA